MVLTCQSQLTTTICVISTSTPTFWTRVLYPHFSGWKGEEFTANITAVNRGDLRRLNYYKNRFRPWLRIPLGELATLSQTPESDGEGIPPPYFPPSRLRTKGHLILLLNWYAHFLDQSYAPNYHWWDDLSVNTRLHDQTSNLAFKNLQNLWSQKQEEIARIHLEINVNLVETIWFFWKLFPDVLGAYEDALEVRPSALDLHPDGDDHVCCRQFLLPRRHLVKEVRNKLRSQHVLKLDLNTICTRKMAIANKTCVSGKN